MDISAESLGITTAVVRKYNTNHDGAGRFSSGMGGASISAAPGLSGDAVSRAEASRLYSQALRAEPAITQRMTSISTTGGFKLEGLAHRVKAPDSLARKIHADSTALGITPAAAASSISDSIRYTGIVSGEKYTRSTARALGALRAAGYKTRVKNYWKQGDPYQGINVALTSPDGHAIELQFHTPESFHMKEFVQHPLYEKYRMSTSNTERKALWDQMTQNAASLSVPPGALSIPDLKLQSFQPVI